MSVSNVIAQSFRDKGFGLPIAEENALYKPTSRTPYVELRMLDAGMEGITFRGVDEQISILQASLNYPVGSGDTDAKAKAQEIIDSYSFDDSIPGAGQVTIVTRKSQFEGEAAKGWYKIVVRIVFLTYLTRL